jgi:hypothetical protein
VITEADIGADPDNLYFPGVSSCTILVMLLSDDSLIGAHLDKDLTSFNIYFMLGGLSELKAARTVRKMAMLGNFTWAGKPGTYTTKPEFSAQRDKATFSEAFDYTGPVLTYDQGMFANKHYRVQAAGAGNWAIYSADVTYKIDGAKKSPVTFDPRRTIWLAQPVSA